MDLIWTLKPGTGTCGYLAMVVVLCGVLRWLLYEFACIWVGFGYYVRVRGLCDARCDDAVSVGGLEGNCHIIYTRD